MYRLWWKEAHKRYRDARPPSKHRAYPTWENLPSIAKVEFYHWALAEYDYVLTFTLRLRHDVEAKALRKPDAAEWLRRAVARELKAALGRNVQLFGCLEVDDADGLHVHGEFNVTDNEIERARAALRRAGGEWPTCRQKQAHSHPDAPDAGWASYVGKDLYKTTPFVRALLARHGSPELLVPYSGDPLFVSRELRQRAKVMFNRDRWQLMKHRVYLSEP